MFSTNTYLADVKVQKGVEHVSKDKSGPEYVFDVGYSARANFCIPFRVKGYYFEIDVDEDAGTG